MKVLCRKTLVDSRFKDKTLELQIGYPTNDPDLKKGCMSVRVEMRSSSGKFLRSSPEFPVEWVPILEEFVKNNKSLIESLGAIRDA